MADRVRFDIDAGDVTLAADHWPGDGPSLVLLHAGITDRRSWYEVAERLAGVGDIVAYDRRGFGDTPLGAGAFSDAADVRAALQALGDEPRWLVGNSMGGALALGAALRRPERVAGLVLIGTAMNGWPEELFELDDATLQLEQRVERAERSRDVDELASAAAWLWLDGPTQPEGRVAGAPRSLFAAMVRGVTRHDDGTDRGENEADVWSQLGCIDVPALVLCGEYDTPLLKPLTEASRLMPRAEFRCMPGTAHLPMLDQPEQTAMLIAGFIREHPT